jgi:uncharacterized coiled-coil protein SlyX
MISEAIFLDALSGLNYTSAVFRISPGTGPSLPVGENRNVLFQEDSMAKINFTLKSVTKEITKAEKKLRAIRGKVATGDQKKINLELRELAKCRKIVTFFCRPLVHYGQTFTAKSKKK